MPTMNISLPEQLKEHIEAQVRSGRYTSASEYMRDLVRMDLNARERDRIEVEILAGLHSGDAIAMTAESWSELEAELTGHSISGTTC